MEIVNKQVWQNEDTIVYIRPTTKLGKQSTQNQKSLPQAPCIQVRAENLPWIATNKQWAVRVEVWCFEGKSKGKFEHCEAYENIALFKRDRLSDGYLATLECRFSKSVARTCCANDVALKFELVSIDQEDLAKVNNDPVDGFPPLRTSRIKISEKAMRAMDYNRVTSKRVKFDEFVKPSNSGSSSCSEEEEEFEDILKQVTETVESSGLLHGMSLETALAENWSLFSFKAEFNKSF
jgi:hypothetical protein